MSDVGLQFADVSEAERIHVALQKEIRVLQHLSSRLERRIRKAKTQHRGSLTMRKEKANAPALITVGNTSTAAPRQATN